MKQIEQDPGSYRENGRTRREPIFAVGGRARLIGVMLGFVVVLVIVLVLSPLASVGYQFSCHFITGSCSSPR